MVDQTFSEFLVPKSTKNKKANFVYFFYWNRLKNTFIQLCYFLNLFEEKKFGRANFLENFDFQIHEKNKKPILFTFCTKIDWKIFSSSFSIFLNLFEIKKKLIDQNFWEKLRVRITIFFLLGNDQIRCSNNKVKLKCLVYFDSYCIFFMILILFNNTNIF